MTVKFLVGDALETLCTLPDASVDLVCTSPPFLALRSYLPADHPSKAKEMGSESTPGAFLDSLLDVIEECARVLTPHGSLCIELGDTYSGSGGAGGDYNADGLRAGQAKFNGSGKVGRLANYSDSRGNPDGMRDTTFSGANTRSGGGNGWPLDKSLCLIPELTRIALAYGFNPLTGRQTERWRIRNVIRWARPNPPVGALADKFRPATSDILVACKGRKRYFDLDAVRTPSDYDRPNLKSMGARGVEIPGKRPNMSQHTTNPAGAPPLDHWWADEEDAFPQDAWKVSTVPYKGAHYACVDDATEALTPSGWRRHDELVDGDLIAAYNATTEQITWQSATFHRYEYDGELVAIDKRETSQRLTPNHRVIHRTRRGVVAVKQAAEAVPSWKVPVAAPFALTPHNSPKPELAALLGWYITEGSLQHGICRLYQSQSANPEKCDEIRRLLRTVGATVREKTRTRVGCYGNHSVEVCWTITGQISAWLQRHAPGKRLTAEVVFGWNSASATALMQALIGGDGHTRQGGRQQFIQKDRDTVDMVQALGCRLGVRSTISRRKDGMYSVTFGERTWLSLRGTNGKHDPIGRVQYRGIVWCPSVPLMFWLARRDGRPFITGNTYPPKLIVPLIEAMCPREVCRECGKPRERMVEANRRNPADNSTRRKNGAAANPRSGFSSDVPEIGWEYDRNTTGWTDCGCGAGFRPGLVLDPFAGTGVTGAVASGCGRDAILIDLDERNLDLARERVGMFLEVPA